MSIPNLKDYNKEYKRICQELSPDKAEKLAELTKLAATLGSAEDLSRATLLRYLTARKWEVDDAFEALKATLQWRDEFRVRDLATKDFLAEGETGKLYCNGFDKDNRPILYLVPSRENTGDHDMHVRLTVYFAELAIRMLPPGVNDILVVFDLRGYSLATGFSFNDARAVIGILASHYPERLGKVILLEAPWAFSCIYKMVWPFVDPVTREKVSFSSLAKRDENHVANFIPREALAKDLGGDSTFTFDAPTYFEHAQEFLGY